MKSLNNLRICCVFCFLLINTFTVQGQIRDTAMSNKSLLLGLNKKRNKDFQAALKLCETAVSYDSLNWRAYMCKANSEKSLGLNSEAIIDYGKVIRLDSSVADAYLGRGNAYLEIGEYSLAISNYNKTIQLDSSEMNPFYGRGNSYYYLEKYSTAILNYNKAIELNPLYSDTYYVRGMAYLNLSDYSKSLKDFNTYIQLGGEGNTAIYAKGISYLFLNDSKNNELIDSAIVTLSNYLKKDSVSNLDTYTYLGRAYTSKLDSMNARTAFMKVVKSKDTLMVSENYFQWGQLEYKLRHFQRALDLYKLSQKLNNDINSFFYYSVGECYVQLGDTVQALENIKLSLDKDSSFVNSYSLRIDCLNPHYKNNIEQLLSDCNAIIKFSKKRTKLSKAYFVSCNMKIEKGDRKGAMCDINKAIEVNINEPFLYTYRGALFLKLHKKKQAEVDIEKAILLESKFWQTYYMKAILDAPVNGKEACPYLRKAQEMGGKVDAHFLDLICGDKSIPLIGKDLKLSMDFNYPESW
jgi:tetratricopeptide (TPR) repeat protein